MESGKLRTRVTIQEKPPVRNTYGEEDPVWKDVCTVWSMVEPLTGREYLEAGQRGAEVSTRVTIRYRAGLRTDMRVVDGTRTYDILSVIDRENRHKEIELMCKEVT